MKKFTDKIFHHQKEGQEDISVEELEYKDISTEDTYKDAHKDTHIKETHKDDTHKEAHLADKHLTKQHSFNTTTSHSKDDISLSTEDKHLTKQHSFSDKIHSAVERITHPTHTHEHEHEHVEHLHVHEHINLPIVETIIRPTIVEETVRRDKVVEVQPIIHRQVDVSEVHHIERHVYEKVPNTGPSVITRQAVVEETIQPHITEELTTVVHREVPAPYIVHEEKHLSEHIIRPPVHTTEIIQEKAAVIAKKDTVIEERRVAEWEDAKVDNCPLALQEKLKLNDEQITTTTTTTIEPDFHVLEEKHLGRIPAEKDEKRFVPAGGLPDPIPSPSQSFQKFI